MTAAGSAMQVPPRAIVTTEQLRREIAALHEIIEMRLVGMDRATKVLAGNVISGQDSADKHVIRTFEQRAKQLRNLGARLEKKFASIAVQIIAQAACAEHAAAANKVILDAALQVPTEAVSAENAAAAAALAKSEDATFKQIANLCTISQSSTAILSDRVGDLKARLDRTEATTTVACNTRRDRHLNSDLLVTVIGICVLVFSVLAGLLGFTVE